MAHHASLPKVLLCMKENQKSILITGASGFLGTYLSAACKERGYDLAGISSTAPAKPALWKNFAEENLQDVDFVRFLAGRRLDACFVLSGSASVSDSIVRPADDFTKLLPGVARLLEYLARHQMDCHVVLYSSAAVYGNPVDIPIGEESAINPLSPYGAHKWLCEELLRNYSNIFGLRTSVLRIFSAYGPGLQRQLFWDLINKYEEAIHKRTFEVTLSGTGFESRDFIHASDVTQAALLIMQREPAGGHQVYNVANGASVSIQDAAHSMMSMLRKKARVNFSGIGRPGDPQRWQADIKKLQFLSYKQSVDLDDGFRTYVEWLHGLGKDAE